MEGRTVDQGQAELGVDTNHLLGLGNGNTVWKSCLGWSEVWGDEGNEGVKKTIALKLPLFHCVFALASWPSDNWGKRE